MKMSRQSKIISTKVSNKNSKLVIPSTEINHKKFKLNLDKTKLVIYDSKQEQRTPAASTSTALTDAHASPKKRKRKSFEPNETLENEQQCVEDEIEILLDNSFPASNEVFLTNIENEEYLTENYDVNADVTLSDVIVTSEGLMETNVVINSLPESEETTESVDESINEVEVSFEPNQQEVEEEDGEEEYIQEDADLNISCHFMASAFEGDQDNVVIEVPISEQQMYIPSITDSPAQCPVCNQTFPTYKSLKIHSKVHDKVKNLKAQEAKSHQVKIASNSNYINCSMCDAKFINHDLFSKHISSVHMDQLTVEALQECAKITTVEKSSADRYAFNCTLCSFHTYDRFLLEKHYTSIHHTSVDYMGFRKHYMCQSCPKSFSEQSHLDLHYRLVHGEYREPVTSNFHDPTFHCPQCLQSFQCKKFLEQHMKVMHKPKGHRCITCGREFISAANYDRHIKVCKRLQELKQRERAESMHHEAPRKCFICKKTLKSLTIFERHYQLMHTNVIKKTKPDNNSE